jgi:flagellar motility protein MotE (MotC chaperone)
MDSNQGLIRFLAYTVLACCGAMALCLSLLCFTLATGELPFGLEPLMRVEEGTQPADLAEIDRERERLARQRYGEVYAARLYAALNNERERVAAEREEIEEKRRELEEFGKTIELLKKDLQTTTEQARNLLDTADATERANVRRLSAILAASEPAVGAQMLLRVPVGTAARLIEAMDARRSGEVIAALAAMDGEEEAARVGEILVHFQKLASASPEVARKGTP